MIESFEKSHPRLDGFLCLQRYSRIWRIKPFDEITIDRLFVVGRIHEAQRSPSKFDHAGKLPDTKKLAGIKSKEYQGEGFKLSLFRYPEDVSSKDQPSQQQKKSKSASKK